MWLVAVSAGSVTAVCNCMKTVPVCIFSSNKMQGASVTHTHTHTHTLIHICNDNALSCTDCECCRWWWLRCGWPVLCTPPLASSGQGRSPPICLTALRTPCASCSAPNTTRSCSTWSTSPCCTWCRSSSSRYSTLWSPWRSGTAVTDRNGSAGLTAVLLTPTASEYRRHLRHWVGE